jgi:N-acetylglutamate synthase-like GNAT family acetyltransferase
MMKLNIRKATVNDAAAISRLLIPLVKKFISHEFSTEGEKNMLASFSGVAIEKNISGDFEYFVALEMGELGGLASADTSIIGVLGIKSSNHLYHCFVDSNYHKQNIGSRLWDFWLLQQNRNQLEKITVNSSKFAIGFYEKIGFARSTEVFEKNGVTCYPMSRSFSR